MLNNITSSGFPCVRGDVIMLIYIARVLLTHVRWQLLEYVSNSLALFGKVGFGEVLSIHPRVLCTWKRSLDISAGFVEILGGLLLDDADIIIVVLLFYVMVLTG